MRINGIKNNRVLTSNDRGAHCSIPLEDLNLFINKLIMVRDNEDAVKDQQLNRRQERTGVCVTELLETL